MGDLTTERVQGKGNSYDAVFTDKTDNSQLSQSDFLNLMVAQMQNQDFTNPMDNSQMITQMVQFSNMQQMQEMAAYSKTNYAMSLVGKTVTASRYTVSGELDTTTGKVDKVSLVDNEYVIYVGGKKYTLAQIMEVQSGSDSSTVAPENYEISASDITSDSVKVSWEVPTEDDITASGLKYSLYYSKDSSFTSVEEIEKNGTLAGSSSLSTYTNETISGLEPGTEYYINVVVKDADGNKKAFAPIKVTTKK